MDSPPVDLLKVLCVKQLSASDAANSKQIKLPKSDARKFVGELRHKQSSSVEVIDTQGGVWTFLCTCYGCQYALSRVGNFCAAYNLKPGQFMVFYIDTTNKLRVSIMRSVPEEWLQKDLRKSPTQSAKPPKPKAPAALPCPAPYLPQYHPTMPPFFPTDIPYAYQQHLRPEATQLLSSFMHDQQAVAAGIINQRSSFSQLPGYHQAALPIYTGSKTHAMHPAADTPASKKPRTGEHTAWGSADSDSCSSQHWESTAQTELQHSEVNSALRARRMPQALPPMRPVATSQTLPASKAAFLARPQAESPTSEESNQDFHMPHTEQQTRISHSHSEAALPAPGSPATVLLSKQLSKMDVACAHDTIGIVLAADDVLASGLLRGGTEQLCFMLKDTSGTNHQCRLSASRNRKFCYLSGLGTFLQQEQAQAGDQLSVQLAGSGRLMVLLVPQVLECCAATADVPAAGAEMLAVKQ